MKEGATFIILHESAWQSLLKDVTTFAMVVGVGLVGWWLNSRFLEIFGGAMIVLVLVSRLSGSAARMTPDEAVRYIKEIARVDHE